MTRKMLLLLALLLAATTITITASAEDKPATATTAVAPFGIGQPAPHTDLQLAGFAGDEEKSWSIQDVAGEKGTLVIFTCNHCPYVKAWQDRVVAHANAALEQGFGVIAINANDPEKYPTDNLDGMKTRAAEKGMKYPYVVDDGTVAKAFGATKTPEFFLFDGSGALVYHGAFDNNAEDAAAADKNWLADAMASVAKGEPVAVAESKALGCSIKFREGK